MTVHATAVETLGHGPFKKTRATCVTCLWAGDWHLDSHHVRQDLADHTRQRLQAHECRIERIRANGHRATCECGWTAAGSSEGALAIKINQHGGSLQ